jgi:recombination protein RecA
MRAAQLKAQIEQTLPAAFTVYQRRNEDWGSIPTGISQIDDAVRGVPLHALTEICGSNPGSPAGPGLARWRGSLTSSGKTSVLVSLLAQATRDHFCALVDAADGFDPASGQAAGIAFPRLLWVRCGKNRRPQTARLWRDGVENRGQLPPLEQAFKVADILLQSGGFGLIAVDLSGISEHIVRKIPLSSWFRFSRVIERQPAALVFLAQEPHATSCAGLVLRLENAMVGRPSLLSGKLLADWKLNVEVVRGRDKKPAGSERRVFSLTTQ